MMSLLEGDVLSQRRGIIVVFWMQNVRMDINNFIARGKTQSAASSFPMRAGAAHYCFPSDVKSSSSSGGGGGIAKHAAFAQLIMKLPGYLQTHIRIHTGELSLV